MTFLRPSLRNNIPLPASTPHLPLFLPPLPSSYPRPILHGLCTLGYAARAVLRSFAAGDVAAFRWVKGRFLSHVFPGETLLTRMQRPAPLRDDPHAM